MAERLNRLGIQSRSAAILAKMLGIHIAVAVAWQRASSGDWAAYAAEISWRAEKFTS